MLRIKVLLRPQGQLIDFLFLRQKVTLPHSVPVL